MSDPIHEDDSLPWREARREPVFNIPGVVLAAILICCGLHVIRVYVLDVDQDLDLLLRTAFIPVRYSGQFDLDVYAFTSPVTYSFLHGGWAHLAVNMVWLAAFGSPLANRIGAVQFCLFWIFTALAAAGLHYVIHHLDQSPLVGASGAIAGMMGAAARFGFRMERTGGRTAFGGPPLAIGVVLRSRTVVIFLAVWMSVNLVTGLVGLTPGMEGQIAWEAHVGGFVAGFFGIFLFVGRRPRRP